MFVCVRERERVLMGDRTGLDWCSDGLCPCVEVEADGALDKRPCFCLQVCVDHNACVPVSESCLMRITVIVAD